MNGCLTAFLAGWLSWIDEGRVRREGWGGGPGGEGRKEWIIGWKVEWIRTDRQVLITCRNFII